MAIKNIHIPPGTPLMIGSPAAPMAESITQLLGVAARSVGGVTEVHFPQMFAVGVMEAPSQVLVIVTTADVSDPQVWSLLARRLGNISPELNDLHIWLVPPTHEMLDDIRRTDCEL